MQRFRQQVAELEDPAGLTAREGPGVVVTLSDAPEEVIDAANGDKNLLVVHQQDIQAVVNAMWKGGARRSSSRASAWSPRPASSARAAR